MTSTIRTVFLGLAALAAVGLAACGGGGTNPGVASLSGAHGGSVTTTTLGTHDVALLFQKWAQCMRQHGVDMPDPVIDNQGGVSVSITGKPGEGAMQGAMAACESLRQAAQTAARGGAPVEKPDPTKVLNFAKCMRAHGIADFPDPSSGGGLELRGGPGSDLSPNNPTFQAAQTACQPILGSLKGGMRIQAGGPGPGPAVSGTGK
jgi:hypothetical protein